MSYYPSAHVYCDRLVKVGPYGRRRYIIYPLYSMVIFSFFLEGFGAYLLHLMTL